MLPWLAFTACCLIWGSTWMAHKWALVDFTPLGLSSVRFLCAGVLCLLIARLSGERFVHREHLPSLLLAGLIMVGAANVVSAWTLLYIPSGVGAVLQAPIPVWMALLTLRSEPLKPSGWLAVVLGFVGVTLVMWPQQTGSIPWFPALVCALVSVAWSWASLLQRARVRSGGLFANAGVQMLFSGLIGSSLTPWLGGFTHGDGPISTQAWSALIYLILAGSCIAFASYLYLVRVWHPARAGSFSYITPMIAVLLGWRVGHEPLGAHLLAGMAVILVAVAVLQWATRQTSGS
jgi:drug/metabolite transporter (DMT)-like permease